MNLVFLLCLFDFVFSYWSVFQIAVSPININLLIMSGSVGTSSPSTLSWISSSLSQQCNRSCPHAGVDNGELNLFEKCPLFECCWWYSCRLFDAWFWHFGDCCCWYWIEYRFNSLDVFGSVFNNLNHHIGQKKWEREEFNFLNL